MVTDGVRVGVLPADRRLPRPLAAHLRARRRRAPRRRADLHPHPRDRHRRRATAAVRARAHRVGRHRGRGRRQRRRHVRRRDRAAGRACACRSSRSRTSTSSRSRSRRCRRRARRTATCRRCATPTCSSTTARRAAAWSWAATSATARRGRSTSGSSTASRRLQRPPARGGLGPLRGDHRELAAAGPVDGRPDGHEAHQRARGVHPRQRVLPRRDRGRAASSSPPGFCAHGLAGAGGIGKVMAEWIHAGEPQLDLWHMDVRRFGAAVPLAVLHAQARQGGLRDLLRHPLPGPRAAGRPAAARLAAPTSGTATHGAAFGEKSGWERVNWYESNAARRRRVAAPARLGRACTGRRRSAPSTAPRARRAALFDESSLRQARDRRARARRRSSSACATTASRAASGRSPTRRCSTRAAGSSATSPSRGSAEDRFSIVTGTAFGQHDAAWMRQHAPRDGSVEIHDMTARWACFALWGPRARDILAAAHARTRWRTRTSPT